MKHCASKWLRWPSRALSRFSKEVNAAVHADLLGRLKTEL